MITGSDLFRAIADQIEAHPETYDQSVWGEVDDNDFSQLFDFLTAAEHMAVGSCDTRGCTAGWAIALNIQDPQVRISMSDRSITAMAADLLEIDSRTAMILFMEDWEPAAGMTVPEALRELANGATIHEVTSEDWYA